MRILLSLISAFVLLGAAAHAADANEAIIQSATAYVKKETAITDPLVKVEGVSGDFARVQVKSKSNGTDPAMAFLKRANGKWKVLSLGTAFEPAELKRLQIPASLQP
jgi:hypothetical protein